MSCPFNRLLTEVMAGDAMTLVENMPTLFPSNTIGTSSTEITEFQVVLVCCEQLRETAPHTTNQVQ